MQIKIISDTHNHHHELNSKDLECDLLIHCGDANTKGNYSEGEAFIYWFVKQPAKYKILVPGNHDYKLRTHPDLIRLCHDLGIHVLNDNSLNIHDIKMYGVSKTFWSEHRSETNYDINERIKAWENIPKGLDILITHMPPKYILDMNQEGEHCGCSKLTEKMKEVKPKYHIFGHIHEQGGKTLQA